MLPSETDVLIIGAGPTGLALAITLQQAGIRHLLVDRLPAGQNTSRAAVIHAHTLETLDSIGVSGALVGRGIKVSNFAIRDRDRALLGLSFARLTSRHPYLLMLPQDVTETVLADRLASLGGTIHRGMVATAVVQEERGARVSLSSPDGDVAVKARFVVGADGMHSVVREAAGIAFDGSPYAESFILADVHMDWPMGSSEVSLFFSAAGLVVVAPLPDGSYRVVATVADAPEHPGKADVQALLDARGPKQLPGRVNDVIWSSRFRVHHRLAATYRNRSLLLVGDAAHVHSPAGGQGMNCGLVDACVLGRLLSEVVRGERPEAALDIYEELRRPAAAEVLELSGRLTKMATIRGGLRRFVRNGVLRTVSHFPPVRRKLELNLSGLSRRHLVELPPHGAAALRAESRTGSRAAAPAPVTQ